MLIDAYNPDQQFNFYFSQQSADANYDFPFIHDGPQFACYFKGKLYTLAVRVEQEPCEYQPDKVLVGTGTRADCTYIMLEPSYTDYSRQLPEGDFSYE